MSNDAKPPDESEVIAGLAVRAVVAPKTLRFEDSRQLGTTRDRNRPGGGESYQPDTVGISPESPWKIFQRPSFWLIFFAVLVLLILAVQHR